MMIVCRAINTRAEIQEFCCRLNSLEDSLDVISVLAAQGNRLLDVVLMDEYTITPLPLEAFDGQLLSEPIRHLEQQWKRLLAIPKARTGTKGTKNKGQ